MLIKESASKCTGARWACIHSGWICDDIGYDVSQLKCRIKTLSLLQKVKENGQRFIEEVGVEEVIMVDLLRRSGQFEWALRICNDGLKKNPQRLILDILNFQKILINKSDVAYHPIAEATLDNKA